MNRQSPCNGRPLALTAADMVRVTVSEAGIQTALLQQPGDLDPYLRSGHTAVAKTFTYAVAQGTAGIEGRNWRLKNHLDGAVKFTQPFACLVGNVCAVQENPAFGGVEQTGDQLRDG